MRNPETVYEHRNNQLPWPLGRQASVRVATRTHFEVSRVNRAWKAGSDPRMSCNGGGRHATGPLRRAGKRQTVMWYLSFSQRFYRTKAQFVFLLEYSHSPNRWLTCKRDTLWNRLACARTFISTLVLIIWFVVRYSSKSTSNFTTHVITNTSRSNVVYLDM